MILFIKLLNEIIIWQVTRQASSMSLLDPMTALQLGHAQKWGVIKTMILGLRLKLASLIGLKLIY